MIGDVAFTILKEDERQAEIGFTLARRYHGQGYAGEAVERLLAHLLGERRLHRVRANCDVENTASARLLERVGMRREAHLVESLWFKGHWASEYWYAILREEWEARQR
jgi:RimJ/RimL family protein N-acetyltransferase